MRRSDMTINRAMQLEIVNNELITVLLGLTARVRTAVKMLEECDHDHANVATLLSTFQAEALLQQVAPTKEYIREGMTVEKMARSELQGEKEAAAEPFLMRYAEPQSQADYVKERLEGVFVKSPSICSNPHCVDGLAPRKTGPDDGDVDMEPCPACGGPNAN